MAAVASDTGNRAQERASVAAAHLPMHLRKRVRDWASAGNAEYAAQSVEIAAPRREMRGMTTVTTATDGINFNEIEQKADRDHRRLAAWDEIRYLLENSYEEDEQDRLIEIVKIMQKADTPCQS